MLKDIFINKTKTEIIKKLKELGFTDSRINSILEQMEDQVRTIKKDKTGNLEDYSFEVNHTIMKIKYQFHSVVIL